MTNVEALKKVAVALGCATSVNDIKADTIAEVLEFIANNYVGGGIV